MFFKRFIQYEKGPIGPLHIEKNKLVLVFIRENIKELIMKNLANLIAAIIITQILTYANYFMNFFSYLIHALCIKAFVFLIITFFDFFYVFIFSNYYKQVIFFYNLIRARRYDHIAISLKGHHI